MAQNEYDVKGTQTLTTTSSPTFADNTINGFAEKPFTFVVASPGTGLGSPPAGPVQGEQVLTSEGNLVSAASDGDCVTLPTHVNGRVLTVFNAGANDIDIFPASGDSISTFSGPLAVDVAFSLPPFTAIELFANITPNQWNQTTTAYQFQDASFANITSSGYYFHGYEFAITAGTTQTQAGGYDLTKSINGAFAGNIGDAVTLPGPELGQQITVINTGNNAMQIFPASGDSLGAGTNNSITLEGGATVVFLAFGSTSWTEVLRSGESSFAYTSDNSITASSTQTQGQEPLISAINVVTTIGSANDVVTLPSAVQGVSLLIQHNAIGGNDLQVFPASGDNIMFGGDNASITVLDGEVIRLTAADSQNWIIEFQHVT